MVEFILDLDYQKPRRWIDYYMWMLIMPPQAKQSPFLWDFGQQSCFDSRNWGMEAGGKTVSEVAYFFFIYEAFIMKHVQSIQLTFIERLLLDHSPYTRCSKEESENLQQLFFQIL